MTWVDTILQEIQKLDSTWQGTGEYLRLTLISNGVAEPSHHNAWGAAVNCAIKRGYLIKTGDYAQMVTEKSHSRSTPIYKRG